MIYSIVINYAEEGRHNRLRVVRNIESNKKEQLLSVLLDEIDMDGSSEKLHLISDSEKSQNDDNIWADSIDEFSIIN